jgi:hypothetical protein
LDAGFVTQQGIRSQQLGQLLIVAILQTGDADIGAGAICIHTSSTLNKMTVDCFTSLIQFQRSIADCKSFFFRVYSAYFPLDT